MESFVFMIPEIHKCLLVNPDDGNVAPETHAHPLGPVNVLAVTKEVSTMSVNGNLAATELKFGKEKVKVGNVPFAASQNEYTL